MAASVASTAERTRPEQEPIDRSPLERILEKHDGEVGSLIAALEEVQAEYGYLPEEALRAVSEHLGRSLVDVYGVATFYRSFSLKPRGKHVVTVCLGTACHIRGGPPLVKEFERQLGIAPGETTPDREFTLETVNCLGACALGPVAVVDGHYFLKVRPTKVRGILDQVRAGSRRLVRSGRHSSN